MFYPLRFSKFTFSDYTCLLSLQVLRISRVYPATLCDLSSIQEEFTSAKSRRSLLFKHLLISGFPSFTMFVFHDNATTEWTNYNATMKKPWNTRIYEISMKNYKLVVLVSKRSTQQTNLPHPPHSTTFHKGLTVPGESTHGQTLQP